MKDKEKGEKKKGKKDKKRNRNEINSYLDEMKFYMFLY